jgi:hypothetical protein
MHTSKGTVHLDTTKFMQTPPKTESADVSGTDAMDEAGMLKLVWKSHCDAVRKQVTSEEEWECPSCLLFKFTMDDSNGRWCVETMSALVSFFLFFLHV